MSETLSLLIERVERATGPDRIVDAEIARDVAGLCLHGSWTREGYNSDTGRRCDDCGADSWGNLGRTGQRLNDPIPAYTASIDAALALTERLLPGFRWGVSGTGIRRGVHEDGKPAYVDGYRARVTKTSPLRPMPSVEDAVTAPLAIILATLRAIEASP